MSDNNRNHALRAIAADRPAEVAAEPYQVEEEFNRYVFTDAVQRQRLPKATYKSLRRAIDNHQRLDADIIDQVANCVKEWAIEMGASHYAHQFQPLTGHTAEKHDAFLEMTGEQGQRAITEFNGSLLSMGEPDGSSFPNGDLRCTSQARGYTFWCTSIPIYIRRETVIIPTIFLSWTGEALGYLYPVMRSNERISAATQSLLRTLEDPAAEGVTRCFSTLGCEQEYFLVDRKLGMTRPDLAACGRTLFGNVPAKNQQLDDHYFGTPSTRVLSYMAETERELWRYGVPVKTRHQEVAPGQFETAPIFEEASVAIAHNNLEMSVMQDIAHKHGLEMLLHEKPFHGVNGSGKHNNYSIATNKGFNLFEPTSDPITNRPFLAALAATMRAVDLHADTLRASIGVYGNDFRLGAAEAPPAIISIFLGSELEAVVQAICDGELDKGKDASMASELHTIELTNDFPETSIHSGDRNRTSPFAFTGNKFEFRAVGSSQNCCFPITVLNTIMSDSITFVDEQIRSRVSAGDSLDKAYATVVRETISKHRRVVFNGDGYSQEWVVEAEKRGLLNLRSAVEAIDHIANEKNTELFSGVLSASELKARQAVFYEQYANAIDIEAKTAMNIARTMILPSAQRSQRNAASSIKALRDAIGEGADGAQVEALKNLSSTINAIISACNKLEAALNAKPHGDAQKEAHYMRESVFGIIGEVRTAGDALESMVEDRDWPLATYQELLFTR